MMKKTIVYIECLLAVLLLTAFPLKSIAGPLIGPGDLLLVTVLGHDSISGEYTVLSDGSIALPVAGTLPLSGLGQAEAALRIAAGLGEYIRNPQVTVNLIREGTQRVCVLGEVGSPGVYEMRRQASLVEAVAMAGGITATGNAAAISLLRKDGERQSLDYQAIITKGYSKDNIQMKDGDILLVPRLQDKKVMVLGKVKTPGSYFMTDKLDLYGAVSMAGGPLEAADMKRVSVLRNDKTDLYDLERFASGADLRQNPQLQPGDVVMVEENRGNKISLLGQVNKPGSYMVNSQLDLHSAMALAGGPAEKADLRKIVVMSGGSVKNYDLDRFVREAALDQNPPVKAGDVVLVSEIKNRVFVLGQVNLPGAYEIKRDDLVLDALAHAGGPARRAVLNNVAVVRQDGGNTRRIQVDVQKALQAGDISENIALQNGDVLFVPETTKPDWDTIFKWLQNTVILKSLTQW